MNWYNKQVINSSQIFYKLYHFHYPYINPTKTLVRKPTKIKFIGILMSKPKFKMSLRKFCLNVAPLTKKTNGGYILFRLVA